MKVQEKTVNRPDYRTENTDHLSAPAEQSRQAFPLAVDTPETMTDDIMKVLKKTVNRPDYRTENTWQPLSPGWAKQTGIPFSSRHTWNNDW